MFGYIIGVLVAVAVVLGVIYHPRGGFNRSYSGRLGAMMSSSKTHRGLWMAAIVAILGLIIWLTWDEIVSLHNSLLGPNFPMWGYAAIVAGLIIAVWIFRMDKEERAKSVNLAEWLIGLAAIGGALLVFNNWEKKDALCPDKQTLTSVPATGMVVDLQSCWDEPFVALDLRQVGVTELSFNSDSAVLRGRTIREFARIQAHVPGATDGQGRLVFNSEEMRKYGITTLPVFVGPAKYQPGAIPRFTDADLQALSQ